jgi:hypothetical protein
MLIPLGILAAAAVQPPAGAYELIENISLTGDSGGVTFSNLSQYSGTYRHLQIRGLSRCTNNGSLAALMVRFNGDAGTNYSNHVLESINNVVYSGNGVSHNQIAHYIPGNTVTTGSFAPMVMDILDAYSTSKNTTTRAHSGFTAPGNWTILQFSSGAWYNTSALSSISILPNQSALLAGCSYSLYGVR